MSRATILVARIFPDCTNAWWPQPKGASRSLWCNDRAIKPKLPHGKPQKLSPPSFIRRICLTAYMKPRSPRRSWQQPSVSWSTPCLRWPNYPSTICHTRRPQKMYSIYIYSVQYFLKHMYFSKIYHPWWFYSVLTQLPWTGWRCISKPSHADSPSSPEHVMAPAQSWWDF